MAQGYDLSGGDGPAPKPAAKPNAYASQVKRHIVASPEFKAMPRADKVAILKSVDDHPTVNMQQSGADVVKANSGRPAVANPQRLPQPISARPSLPIRGGVQGPQAQSQNVPLPPAIGDAANLGLNVWQGLTPNKASALAGRPVLPPQVQAVMRQPQSPAAQAVSAYAPMALDLTAAIGASAIAGPLGLAGMQGASSAVHNFTEANAGNITEDQARRNVYGDAAAAGFSGLLGRVPAAGFARGLTSEVAQTELPTALTEAITGNTADPSAVLFNEALGLGLRGMSGGLPTARQITDAINAPRGMDAMQAQRGAIDFTPKADTGAPDPFKGVKPGSRNHTLIQEAIADGHLVDGRDGYLYYGNAKKQTKAAKEAIQGRKTWDEQRAEVASNYETIKRVYAEQGQEIPPAVHEKWNSRLQAIGGNQPPAVKPPAAPATGEPEPNSRITQDLPPQSADDIPDFNEAPRFNPSGEPLAAAGGDLPPRGPVTGAAAGADVPPGRRVPTEEEINAVNPDDHMNFGRSGLSPEDQAWQRRKVQEVVAENGAPHKQVVSRADVQEAAAKHSPEYLDSIADNPPKDFETLGGDVHKAMRDRADSLASEAHGLSKKLKEDYNNLTPDERDGLEAQFNALDDKVSRYLDVTTSQRSQAGRNLAHMAAQTNVVGFDSDYWMLKARKAAGGKLDKPTETQLKRLLASGREAQGRLDEAKAREASGQPSTAADTNPHHPDAVMGRLSAETVNLSHPSSNADAALHGARKIRAGIARFADWARAMVEDLGDRIKPHLRTLWGHAQNLARRVNGDERGAIGWHSSPGEAMRDIKQLPRQQRAIIRKQVAQERATARKLLDDAHAAMSRAHQEGAETRSGERRSIEKMTSASVARMSDKALAETQQRMAPGDANDAMREAIDQVISARAEWRRLGSYSALEDAVQEWHAQTQAALDDIPDEALDWSDFKAPTAAKASPPLVKRPAPAPGTVDHAEAELQNIRIEMAKILGGLEKTPHLEAITSGIKAALLSGMRTIEANTGGNILNQGALELDRLPGVLHDLLASAVTGQRAFSGVSGGAIARAAKQGAVKGGREAIEILKHGKTKADLSKMDVPREVNSHFPLIGEKANKVYSAIVNTIFRVQSAQDRPVFEFALRRSIEDQALMIAKNEAKAGDLGGMTVKERAAELVADPPAYIAAQAAEEALIATFNNDNVVSGKISQSKAWAKRQGLTGQIANAVEDIHLPFTKVPVNMVARVALDGTGISYGARVAGQVGSRVVGAVKADSGAKLKALMKPLSFQEQRELSRLFGSGVTGLGMISLGMLLASKGLATGYSSKDEQGKRGRNSITGETEGAFRRPGGDWHQLTRLGPKFLLAAVGASMYEQATRQLKDASAAPYKVAAAAVRPVKDLPMLQGVKNINDALDDPDKGGDRYAAGIGRMLIPSAVRDVASAMDDTKRAPSGFLEGIQSGIPGLRNRLPIKTDAFGRPSPETPVWDFTNSSEDRTSFDPVAAEIQRLRVNVNKADRTIEITGPDKKAVRHALGPDNHNYYAKSFGDMANIEVSRAMGKASYAGKGEDDQKGEIEDALRRAKTEATKHMKTMMAADEAGDGDAIAREDRRWQAMLSR